MDIDLKKEPFTIKDSYLVVSYITEDFKILAAGGHSKEEGMALRTVRRDGRKNPVVGIIVPLVDGREVPYTYRATPEKIRMEFEGGRLEICFADIRTILIRGNGRGVGMRLKGLSDKEPYDYLVTIPYEGDTYYMANLFRHGNKFILFNQEGRIAISREEKEPTTGTIHAEFCEEDGSFLAVIEEARIEWKYRRYHFDFDQCAAANRNAFHEFCSVMGEVPKSLVELRNKAAYVNWCNCVGKDVFLTRPTIYASNNWMTGSFSWDHCFAAFPNMYHNPEHAWDQFMIQFDYQDETGRLADRITEMSCSWSFCKPPIHGWALARMRRHMELTDTQKREAYEKLAKWSHWWFHYRDNDQDGICEYYHGNDSGWDNSTVFRYGVAVESPELTAFLIIQSEVLADLAGELGRRGEEREWRKRSKEQLEAFLNHCIDQGMPIAKTSYTHRVIENESLLPYESIILGKRLPKEVADRMVKEIKDRFLTPYGLSTEAVSSAAYDPDGYWRGPIWGPSTLIILDGLVELGEKELVGEIAWKYAELARKSGFSENYNALTGEGLRDRAYEWGASVFQVIAHEYLS